MIQNQVLRLQLSHAHDSLHMADHAAMSHVMVTPRMHADWQDVLDIMMLAALQMPDCSHQIDGKSNKLPDTASHSPVQI